MSAAPSPAVTTPYTPVPEPVTRRDGPPRRFLHSFLADSGAVLGHAAGLMVAVEADIGDLWRDTIDCGDRVLSERLVELSHALRRASLVLEAEPMIGLERTRPPAVLELSEPKPAA